MTDNDPPHKKVTRQWPCRTFAESELKVFNGSPFRLFLSNRDRVDLGEAMFYRIAQHIPTWVAPNAISWTALFLNIIVFFISFMVAPAVEGEWGDWAATYLPTLISWTMAAQLVLVCMLDCFDGLHARGTNQTSNLGALLDHYFDSITVATTCAAIVVLLVATLPARLSASWPAVLSMCSGPVIFNLELLTNHYLNQSPRVAGPEAQLAGALACLVIGTLFLLELHHFVQYVAWACPTIALCTLVTYAVHFAPRLSANRRALIQMSFCWASYVCIWFAYCSAWLSMFEVCVTGVFIAWDLNGQIVTHHVLHMELPLFTHCTYTFLLLPFAVILETNYLLIDAKTDIHFATLALWVVLLTKNVRHFMSMTRLLETKTAAAASTKTETCQKKRQE